jgi:alpha-tubulin suppressor-like RCC1 family protein
MNALRSQAGIDHTCALDGIGKAWCWGNNLTPGIGFGQAGVPSLTRVPQPMLVADERIYSALGAGQYSTCGVSAGVLYCWGAVDNNLSGGATWQPTPIPAPVPFQDVGVGYQHACALSGTGGVGQARCIGSSGFDLFPSVTRLSSKVNTTCAELQNGTVMCAGENGWGQLGNGTFSSSFVPQLVGNGQPLRGVSVGANHACAIDPAGQAWCWGNGFWGEFGDGTSRLSPTPVRAGGNLTYIAIAAGYQHTCAIGTDHQVYCWGRNYEGELGINSIGGWWSTPVATVPVPM